MNLLFFLIMHVGKNEAFADSVMNANGSCTTVKICKENDYFIHCNSDKKEKMDGHTCIANQTKCGDQKINPTNSGERKFLAYPY